MKKIILLAIFFTAALSSVQSQNMADNAIGLRFTENSGLSAEFTYQRKLADANRLEIDLGIRDNFFKATGLYEWVNHLDGDFNWYVGAGGGLASGNNYTNIFGAGIVGVEYSFDFPIMISLDFRPELYLFDNVGFQTDFGLSVRYQF